MWFLNIYNKKVLNGFPFPWLTSTLSLAAGSLIMLVSWATNMVDPPNTDFKFWNNLFPVTYFAATIQILAVFAGPRLQSVVSKQVGPNEQIVGTGMTKNMQKLGEAMGLQGQREATSFAGYIGAEVG